jgi:hypothetical protein
VNGRLVEPQEVAPQVEGGCDYGTKGIVLVRYGKARLVWRKGHKVWSGVGFPWSYYHASLHVVGIDSRVNGGIFEGGRLTVKRLAEHMGKIVGLMGLPGLLDTSKLDLKKTYLVEEP